MYVYVFRICILPYLCVTQNFHKLYMLKDIAKLATFQGRKKLYVQITYGIRTKERKLRHRNQRDRDRHAAESAQQPQVQLTRWRVRG